MPSAKTPMMARFRAARRWAVSADSIRPPRPRRGRRRASRTRGQGIGHHRVTGGVVVLLHACGGVETGDGGAGQLDGGNGAAGGRQVAQVEGHGLRAGGQSWVAARIGPSLGPQPGGGIGARRVLAALASKRPEATARAAS